MVSKSLTTRGGPCLLKGEVPQKKRVLYALKSDQKKAGEERKRWGRIALRT